MYEIPETQDYLQKWLEAERELAMNWIVLPPVDSLTWEPVNTDRVKDDISEPVITPRNFEDCRPAATRRDVSKSIKKVAASQRRQRGGRPVPA